MNKISNFVFDGVGVPDLKKYLDLASFRHKLITGNVANASTPGYRSRDIDFQAEFERISGRSNALVGSMTHPNHLATGNNIERAPEIDQAKIVEGDLNGIDIDSEISHLAQNELRFTIGARLLKSKFESLRKVITSE